VYSLSRIVSRACYSRSPGKHHAARYPLAFALSLVAAGAVQQGLLMTYEHGAVPGTLMPLAGCILATTFVFNVVLS